MRCNVIFLHGFLGHAHQLDTVFTQSSNVHIRGIDWVSMVDYELQETLYDLAVKVCNKIRSYDTQNVILYGYSMGGRLAQQCLAVDPALFQGLILESAHVGFSNGIERWKSEQQAIKAYEGYYDLTLADFLSCWYEQPLFYKTKDLLDKRELNLKKRHTLFDWLNIYKYFHVSQHINFLSQLRLWGGPILYLCGRDDTKYENLGKQFSNMYSYCDYYSIEGADHTVHCCQPSVLKMHVETFLQKISQ